MNTVKERWEAYILRSPMAVHKNPDEFLWASYLLLRRRLILSPAYKREEPDWPERLALLRQPWEVLARARRLNAGK